MLKASQSTPAGRNLSATSQNIRLGLGCIAGSPHLHGVDTATQFVSGSASGRNQWIGGYVFRRDPRMGEIRCHDYRDLASDFSVETYSVLHIYLWGILPHLIRYWVDGFFLSRSLLAAPHVLWVNAKVVDVVLSYDFFKAIVRFKWLDLVLENHLSCF